MVNLTAPICESTPGVDGRPFLFLGMPPLVMIALGSVFVYFGLRLEPPRRGAQAGARDVDGWTGLAWFVALDVFLIHQGYVNEKLTGWFFMLSGAKLCLGRGAGGEGCKGWCKFLMRRLARVIPAYWIALCFRLDHWGVWSLTNFFLLEDIVWQPRRDNNLWFICTIFHLYCLFPFVSSFFDMVGTRQSVRRALAVAAASYAFQVATSSYLVMTSDWYDGTLTETLVFGVYVEFYKNPIVRLPLFIQGICCAHIAEQVSSGDKSLLRILGRLTDLSFVAIFVYGVISNKVSESGQCDQVMWGIFCDGSIFAAQTMMSPLFCIPLVGLGSAADSYAQYILTQPVILLLGKWSYGVYLYGQSGYCSAGYLMVVATYAKFCALGGVSSTLIEKPSQDFVTWLTTPAAVADKCESLSSSTSEDEDKLSEGGVIGE